jgi:hypothetical protein
MVLSETAAMTPSLPCGTIKTAPISLRCLQNKMAMVHHEGKKMPRNRALFLCSDFMFEWPAYVNDTVFPLRLLDIECFEGIACPPYTHAPRLPLYS